MSASDFPSAGVRINLVVEGDTEERFVNSLLAGHFGMRGAKVVARRVTISRKRGKVERGGMPAYERVRYDIEGWLKEDVGAYVSTMFDLYGLDTGFPGYAEVSKHNDCYDRVKHLEEALAADMNSERFIPYLQVHEFEALLFSAPDVLDAEMVKSERASRLNELKQILEECGEPERINDNWETAPSKRLDKIYRGYPKKTMGTQISDEIGLESIRRQCRHFDEWLRRLEDLSPQPGR